MEEIDQAKDQGKDTKRLWDEMGQKTKSRTIKNDKLESKICIKQCKARRCVIVKDIIKIRVCMCDLKKNYHNKKEEKQPLCPSCEVEDDTTEHVLKCRRNTNRKQRNIKNNTEKEWEEVVQIIYRKQKKK